MTGEGKGRLGFEKQQHLFSYDSLLKEGKDWVLAVTIPLHGEEVLILTNLKDREGPRSPDDSLSIRMERGIADYLRSKKQSGELAGKFLNELRLMVRFVLHKQLDLIAQCGDVSCEFEGQTFPIEASPRRLSIKRMLAQGHVLELVAENLTGSIFTKSSFVLRSQTESSEKLPILSLELFWK